MTVEQAARDFFGWFNRHYPAPSTNPDHEWNRLGVVLANHQEEAQAAIEGAIRDKLIELGWTPPDAPKVAPAAQGDALDSERLDWLASQTRNSNTGISFDWCRHAEDGRVLERGYRFMSRAFLGARCEDFRAAIDAARAAKEGARNAS